MLQTTHSWLKPAAVAVFALALGASAGFAITHINDVAPQQAHAAGTVPVAVSTLSTKADLVTYLYRCMLDREPDQSGLDFWVGTMATDPDPVNHLYRAFRESGDFNKQINNTEFVNKMYTCVLFRNANAAPDNNYSGRDFWVNEMTSGKQTQSSMLEVFLASGEYKTSVLPKLSVLPLGNSSATNAVTISLSASSTKIKPGETVYLSWGVLNADKDTIIFDNNIGLVEFYGIHTVVPSKTTTYTLSGSNSLGKVSKSVTIEITAIGASNTKPVGYLDGISIGGQVHGWSYDPDSTSQSNKVALYIDGLDSAHLVEAVSANQSRPDVNIAKGVFGSHGFLWNIPQQYKDNQSHTLYAVGEDLTDASGANNFQLSGSPKSFTLSKTNIDALNVPNSGTNFIASLYNCVLGRTYDTAGFEFWLNQFRDPNHTRVQPVRDMYVAFVRSLGNNERTLNNSEFVDMAFQCVLYRHATDSEQTTWTNYLNTGSTQEMLVSVLMDWSEFPPIEQKLMSNRNQ